MLLSQARRTHLFPEEADRLRVDLGEALGLGEREERLEDPVLAWEELREHPPPGELWAGRRTALDFFTGDCSPLWEGEHRQYRLPLACGPRANGYSPPTSASAVVLSAPPPSCPHPASGK